MTTYNVISAEHLSKQLCEALGLAPDRVTRIVLDVQSDNLIRAYVEMVGDKRVLEVSWGDLELQDSAGGAAAISP